MRQDCVDSLAPSPVQHRGAKAQIHLTVIRARAGLVGARTALVNAARGLVKSYGERLRQCGTQQVGRDTAAGFMEDVMRLLAHHKALK